MIWTNIQPALRSRLQQPAVNITETATGYQLHLALPGWRKEEVSLNVDGDLLKVEGRLEREGEELTFRRREFGLSEFEKSFHLPESIDVDAIDATLEHGVLTVQLPKVPEAQPVRKQIAVA